MKLPYKTVLNAVRYCHADYWHPLPNEDDCETILFVIPCIFNANIRPHACYSSGYLLKSAKDTYATDVQAAIDELEMRNV